MDLDGVDLDRLSAESRVKLRRVLQLLTVSAQQALQENIPT
ncbi:hypothetical protein ABIB25_005933 [Nakamurella sp. UYEF19]